MFVRQTEAVVRMCAQISVGIINYDRLVMPTQIRLAKKINVIKNIMHSYNNFV